MRRLVLAVVIGTILGMALTILVKGYTLDDVAEHVAIGSRETPAAS